MRKSLPPSIIETLTAAERAAPFAISDPDLDPLPTPTRLPLIIDGDRIDAINPATGEVLAACHS